MKVYDMVRILDLLDISDMQDEHVKNLVKELYFVTDFSDKGNIKDD